MQYKIYTPNYFSVWQNNTIMAHTKGGFNFWKQQNYLVQT